jgi:GNAT superfamily N-acetyltransferase
VCFNDYDREIALVVERKIDGGAGVPPLNGMSVSQEFSVTLSEAKGLSSKAQEEILSPALRGQNDKRPANAQAGMPAPPTSNSEILAIARLIKLHGTNDAEFALTVSDKWQGHGLGTELLRRLVQIGRDEKVRRITADIHPENAAMLRVCKKVGFRSEFSRDEGVMKAQIDL